MVEIYNFNEEEILSEFKKIETILFSAKHQIVIKYTKNNVLSFDKENQELLKSISGKAIIYSIWIGKEDLKIKYIGPANGRISRQRIRNHLCKANNKTGAKWLKVEEALENGDKIAVSIIEIQPEYMRKAFETWIIQEHKSALPWNINT